MSTVTLPSGPTLHYTDSGGTGPVLMFSHGFLLDGRMFDAQVAALSNDYRCITWDARGHGDTTYDGAPFTYWDTARDLLALLDHLGIDRAVLIGMSQGGFASLRAALIDPRRIRALVLIDSQGGTEAEEAKPLYEGLAEDWVTKGPNPDVLPTVATLVLGPNGHDQWVASWLAREQTEIRQPFRTLMDRDDITGRLCEIQAPSLVLHGSEDLSIPMERAERMAEALPGADGVVVIQGGAHASNVTHPEEVNAAIKDFLANIA